MAGVEAWMCMQVVAMAGVVAGSAAEAAAANRAKMAYDDVGACVFIHAHPAYLYVWTHPAYLYAWACMC